MATITLENQMDDIEELMSKNTLIETNADSNSMKNYIRNFFSDFPLKNPDEKLQKTLLRILSRAFYTTFIGDYDLNEGGIELERLNEFPRRTQESCLDHLSLHSTNNFIPEYIRRYREKYS